jgi:hypothetical protein
MIVYSHENIGNNDFFPNGRAAAVALVFICCLDRRKVFVSVLKVDEHLDLKHKICYFSLFIFVKLNIGIKSKHVCNVVSIFIVYICDIIYF